MSTALTTLSQKMATRFNIGEGNDVLSILKATCFKGPATDAQLTALMIVADAYGLNPFTKEIFAFPDKNNGIVPVVGVDGWSRILNEHPQFDGMDFTMDDESCTCTIYRKDRSHPIKVTEYLSECKRPVGPWQSHPRRMLRHKAMIQCARLAFGYVGIFDQDEAERIAEIKDINAKPARQSASQIASASSAPAVELDPAELARLLADLDAVADNGLEALQGAWDGMSKDQRRAVQPSMAALKERASKVEVFDV